MALCSDLGSDLLSVLDKVADGVASALTDRAAPKVQALQHGLGHRILRDLKQDLSQIHLEHRTIRKRRLHESDPQFDARLHGIAALLDNILDPAYLEKFRTLRPITLENIEYKNLGVMFDLLSQPPHAFDEVEALCVDTTANLLELSSLLSDFSDVINHTYIEADMELNYERGSATKIGFPEPPLSHRALQDPDSVRDLTGRLYQCLHSHWPCQMSAHDHHGTLAECTQINIQLEPQWVIEAPHDGSFFVILEGDNIKQTCKIHFLQHSTWSPTDDDLLCLVLYEFSKVNCLCLVPDNVDRLCDYPAKALEGTLHPAFPQIYSHNQYQLFTIADILEAIEPTFVAKRVVDIILARSVLLFLEGPWVGRPLSKNDISILCEIEDGVPKPHFDKIFVTTRFESNISKGIPRKNPYEHPFPAIRALAILMAEIELGDKLDSIYQRIDPKDANSPVSIARILRDECEKRIPGSGAFRAISFCIDKTSFNNYRVPTELGYPQQNEDFARHYYMNIVRPLEEDLVVGGKWEWDHVNWQKPRDLEHLGIASNKHLSSSSSSSSSQSRNMPSSFGKGLPSVQEEPVEAHRPSGIDALHGRQNRAQPFDGQICIASVEQSLTSDDWFDQLHDVHMNLNRDRMDTISEEEQEELVKIAVLDTGIDLTHPVFAEFLNDGRLDRGTDVVALIDTGVESNDPNFQQLLHEHRCRARRVANNKDAATIVDLDGHGTHVCHTLLKTAPYVKLFPIRVFRTNQSEDSTSSLIRQAIYYAIGTIDVDVISMSFAFEQDDFAIMDALHNARSQTSKQVLMFAAASNNRALRTTSVGYPARATDRVICVNSSSADDEKSKFSPHGIPNQPNFSVIGENVQAAWPLGEHKHEPLKRVSGTSQATPIVAGIAALLLDFAKKDTTDFDGLTDWKKMRGQLWNTFGMRSVLKRHMTEYMKTDGTYNFLKPWKLLLETDFASIAVQITDALKNKHIWA